VKLVANARMYTVTTAAGAAWKQLFGWLSRRSGVPLEPIDHAFPAPLSQLWSRSDLGCAFMCGFPYVHSPYRPKPIAAPVPSPVRFGGRAVYMTDLVVRAGSAFHTLEDTFGQRLGYTSEDSHSGYNAVRHHLLPFRSECRPSLYRASMGPLYTPRRVLDAVLTGDIDVGPLDGYALDLMVRHEPELSQRIRVVATTDPAPIPFLVASAVCPDDIVDRFRSALAEFGEAGECAMLREQLALAKFVPVSLRDYDLISHWHRQAEAAGYYRPA
jgi:ABC-type phosphate/phosphonate transport system substrate-binding protein